MSVPRAFVVGLHLRWDGVWQRPQQIVSRLAKRVPVVVIEEPLWAPEDRDVVMTDGNVRIVRPLRKRGWSAPLVDAQAIATARELTGPGACGVWLYTPMMLELADAFAADPLVFDCMDELAAFDFAPAGIAERDAALVARADRVFAGGKSIFAHRAAAGSKVICEPSGVEVERFGADVAPHPLVAELLGPVFTYTGVIDERIDFDLINALADEVPNANVVLVGPVVKIDPAVLPRRTNVHFTGGQPYASLPGFLAGTDVAIMPFAINRATANISPTKTLEYFAASRSVATTPIRDVMDEFGEIVYAGTGPQAFVEAARAALDAPPERIAAGRAAASARTWDAIVARMWHALDG